MNLFKEFRMTQNEQCIPLVMIHQLNDLYNLLNLRVVLCSHQSSTYPFISPPTDTRAFIEHVLENEQHIVHNSND